MTKEKANSIKTARRLSLPLPTLPNRISLPPLLPSLSLPVNLPQRRNPAAVAAYSGAHPLPLILLLTPPTSSAVHTQLTQRLTTLLSSEYTFTLLPLMTALLYRERIASLDPTLILLLFPPYPLPPSITSTYPTLTLTLFSHSPSPIPPYTQLLMLHASGRTEWALTLRRASPDALYACAPLRFPLFASEDSRAVRDVLLHAGFDCVKDGLRWARGARDEQDERVWEMGLEGREEGRGRRRSWGRREIEDAKRALEDFKLDSSTRQGKDQAGVLVRLGSIKGRRGRSASTSTAAPSLTASSTHSTLSGSTTLVSPPPSPLSITVPIPRCDSPEPLTPASECPPSRTLEHKESDKAFKPVFTSCTVQPPPSPAPPPQPGRQTTVVGRIAGALGRSIMWRR